MKKKFIDFVCSIRSTVFKVIATILIFIPMILGMLFVDSHNMFGFRTISAMLFATLGYGIAVILTMIRYSRGIND